MVADFNEPFDALPGRPGERLVIFLGGTIGNFDEDERAAFLTRVRDALAPGDHFLLGADLVKAPSRLVAAYDDSAGVTAAFNRNLIEVLRTELDADGLYVDDFEHVARWNPVRSRIEMWLRARRPVHAHFGALDRDWDLPAGRRDADRDQHQVPAARTCAASWPRTGSSRCSRGPTRTATSRSPFPSPIAHDLQA